jgi:Lon protease-like protein
MLERMMASESSRLGLVRLRPEQYDDTLPPHAQRTDTPPADDLERRMATAWKSHNVGTLVDILGLELPESKNGHVIVRFQGLSRFHVKETQRTPIGYWEGEIERFTDTMLDRTMLQQADLLASVVAVRFQSLSCPIGA